MSVQSDRAFGEGCQARLLGLGRDSCPYMDKSGLRLYWVSGWTEAHLHYAEDVNGRWEYKPLPPFVYAVAAESLNGEHPDIV